MATKHETIIKPCAVMLSEVLFSAARAVEKCHNSGAG